MGVFRRAQQYELKWPVKAKRKYLGGFRALILLRNVQRAIYWWLLKAKKYEHFQPYAVHLCNSLKYKSLTEHCGSRQYDAYR